jgi:hypothetical protein
MGVMANKDSIERILFAIFSHENHKQGTAPEGNFLHATHSARNTHAGDQADARSSILVQL